jgi:hypothetical protein
MTKRRQQPEKMEWSFEEPNIEKRCFARELWQQSQEEKMARSGHVKTKKIIKEIKLKKWQWNVIS